MNFKDEALLSFYEDINILDKHSHITLVRHIEDNRIYVKKVLSVYNKELYMSLQNMKIPGIPEIFLIFEDCDKLIIIEEYINGITLDKYLHENGILDCNSAVKILSQLCSILNILHKSTPPIIHRDIKPSNIMISPNLTVTLIDFNAAKKFDNNKNRDTVLIGTSSYAAPEQYGFSQSDARTDIYALGTLLNIMLTGMTPKEQLFRGKLSRIISKCTNIDPDRRYSSISKLQKDISSCSGSFLPPGFRTKKLWKMILGTLGYIFITYVSFTLEVENANSVPTILIYRTATFIMLLAAIAVLSNYRNISDSLPLASNKNKAIMISGRLLWALFFILTFMMLAVIVLNIIDPSQLP